MKLLIVAATWNEIKPLEEFLQRTDEEGKLREHAAEIYVTGVGGVQTAFHLGKILPTGNWDLVIQLGICGSFKKELPIGTTVNVVEESFADLGAEDGDIFLDAFQIGLLDADKFPFENGKLLLPAPDSHSTLMASLRTLEELPKAKSISVNKVHGSEQSIQNTLLKYNPEVESMEGAAFFYSCKMASIPFFELRTVSNLVEKRDKSKWNIPVAIEKLNEAAIRILSETFQLSL
jgi:futalosine hydrolase